MKVENRYECVSLLCESAEEKAEAVEKYCASGGWKAVRLTGLVGKDLGKFRLVIQRDLKRTKPPAK